MSTFKLLTADVGAAFLAADSGTFIKSRSEFDAEHLRANSGMLSTSLAADDKMLKNYLATLKLLDAQADLLGAYFAAITQLTDGKASAATITSIDSLLDQLNTLNPQIEKASIGGKTVKDFIAPVTQLVVAHFQVKALDRELQKASAIDTALTLQEAATEALSSQLRDSLSASLQLHETSDVITPFVTPGPLPASWAAQREAYVRETLTIQSADSASTAAKSLHAAYRGLLANNAARVDFKTLLTDIGAMAGYAVAAKASAN